MNSPRERAIAVAFSILLVTAPIGSASSGLQGESTAVGDRVLSDAGTELLNLLPGRGDETGGNDGENNQRGGEKSDEKKGTKEGKRGNGNDNGNRGNEGDPGGSNGNGQSETTTRTETETGEPTKGRPESGDGADRGESDDNGQSKSSRGAPGEASDKGSDLDNRDSTSASRSGEGNADGRSDRGANAGNDDSRADGRSTSNDGENRTTGVVNESIELDSNATALDHRKAALQLLKSADFNPGRGASSGLQRRLIRDLNGTHSTLLDANRTTTATTFRTDKGVVAPLTRRAPNVTAHVVAADAIHARTAIDDAERVVQVLRDRNVSFDETAVRRNITASKQAFEQAEFVRENSRAASIEHYRRAWTRAQRALDTMDDATAPNVTVETRMDQPHRNATDHAVAGEVFDVRPYELDATVAFPNDTRPVSLTSSTVPGTVARFNTSVRLERMKPNGTKVQRINLSAYDPGLDVADRGYDESDRWDVHHPQSGSDVVLLDGDGLSDAYERRVTGTDPTDSDSNSTRTDATEAADGRPDGAEDFDDDGAITFDEYHLDLDPLDPDTDGDGLTDGYEISYPHLNPAVGDTDDDGTLDGAEDFDDDDLVNRREEAAESAPVRADSDGDGLSDGVEVLDHATDPTTADTDDDGLPDPDELELGTDPTDPDTDSDGVLDGQETFTTETTDEETGVTVNTTGDGNVAGGVSIEALSNDSISDGRASHVMHLNAEREFDAATVTIPVAKSADLTNDNLTIVKWDPVDGESIRAVETEIDTANRTATTTVDGFSYFAVVDRNEWDAMHEVRVDPGWPVREGFDDRSGWSGDGSVEEGALVVSHESSDGGGGGGGGGECDVNNLGGDCDGDGLTNGVEILYAPTDPLDPDTDGDGISDGFEVGGPTDPLDPDTDGDGIDDGLDPAPLDPTWPPIRKLDATTADDTSVRTTEQLASASNDASTASRSVSLGDAEEITLRTRVKGEASDADSTAKVVVTGGGDTERVFTVTDGSRSWTTETIDITEFGGTDVTVEVVAEGDATVEVDSISITRDTDGDGILDFVEEQSREFAIPLIRKHGGETRLEERHMNLDPHEADTDGDGLEDGTEVSFNTRPAGGERGEVSETMVVQSVSDYYSHPNLVNSDGAGLTDSEEYYASPRSYATVPETLVSGYSVAMFSQDGDPATASAINAVTEGTSGDTGDYVVLPSDTGCGWGFWDCLNSTVGTVAVDVTVYLQTNEAGERLLKNSDMHAVLTLDTSGSAGTEVVDGDTVSVDEGTATKRFRVEIRQNAGYNVAGGTVSDFGKFELELRGVEDTAFARDGDGADSRPEVSREYATPASVMLPSTSAMLETTKKVFAEGVAIGGAASSGLIIIQKGGTVGRAVTVALYDYAVGKAIPIPTSGTDLAMEATTRGISMFQDRLEQVEEEQWDNYDGEAGAGGQVIVRQN